MIEPGKTLNSPFHVARIDHQLKYLQNVASLLVCSKLQNIHNNIDLVWSVNQIKVHCKARIVLFLLVPLAKKLYSKWTVFLSKRNWLCERHQY